MSHVNVDMSNWWVSEDFARELTDLLLAKFGGQDITPDLQETMQKFAEKHAEQEMVRDEPRARKLSTIDAN